MFQVAVFLGVALLGAIFLIVSLMHHILTRDITVTVNQFGTSDE